MKTRYLGVLLKIHHQVPFDNLATSEPFHGTFTVYVTSSLLVSSDKYT